MNFWNRSNTIGAIRKIEIAGDVFKVNGKAVKLKGVNRHDFHPRMGFFVDSRTMERDIRLIKQANINMIRTSHYPHLPLLYELCDKYGIYVMDEANHESHAYGLGNKVLGDNPQWTLAHVDRAVAVVERDKNHPCILFWSLGNEGGSGANLRAMADTIRALDPTRPYTTIQTAPYPMSMTKLSASQRFEGTWRENNRPPRIHERVCLRHGKFHRQPQGVLGM